MAAMRAVGTGHRLPAHANVHDDGREYVVELDVSDFLPSELVVEVVGPRVTVHGDQLQSQDDDQVVFRLHERLEESFRLPDDADPEPMRAFYAHGTLELHVPRRGLEPRRVPIEHRSPFVGNPNAQAC
jgi:HSP20 family molecular chaperone IbpA